MLLLIARRLKRIRPVGHRRAAVVAGLLWVRIPPEPLNRRQTPGRRRQVGQKDLKPGVWSLGPTSVLVEQPGVLATLSRWRSWVQIPSGTLFENSAVRK